MEELAKSCPSCNQRLVACARCNKGSYCSSAHMCQFCGQDPTANCECCGASSTLTKIAVCQAHGCNVAFCAERDRCCSTCECPEKHLVCSDHECAITECSNYVCTDQTALREALNRPGVTYCSEHRRNLVKRLKSLPDE